MLRETREFDRVHDEAIEARVAKFESVMERVDLMAGRLASGQGYYLTEWLEVVALLLVWGYQAEARKVRDLFFKVKGKLN